MRVSWTRAAISAPNPPVTTASCATTQRCVFRTEFRTVSSSKGFRVSRSMISTDIPSFSNSAATSSHFWTIME